MIQNKSILAIIPARGGSKGLPQKNILPLAGKPLIAWSIEAAKKSKYIDECIISTDSKDIQNIAKKHGGYAPFLRPAKFSLDESPTIEALIHALDFYKKKLKVFDYLVLLEPTSPLRDKDDIDLAIETLNSKRDIAESIVGVTKVEAAHPAFDIKINDKGLIEPYETKSFKILRRQEITDLFYFEGSLYISSIESLLREKSFYHNKTLPFIMPRWKSLEIDEMLDFIAAEAFIKNKKLLK